MIDIKRVEALVNEWLEGKEYFLTDLNVSNDNKVVVEIDHKDGVWIDDCVELSRFIEENLSREEEDYDLEVGSAGLGQPFKVVRQWLNHVGDQVEVLTQDGRKLKGTLTAADGDGFTVKVKEKFKPEGAKRSKTVETDYSFKYGEVRSTRYIFKFK